jgi:Ulp1 family protease
MTANRKRSRSLSAADADVNLFDCVPARSKRPTSDTASRELFDDRYLPPESSTKSPNGNSRQSAISPSPFSTPAPKAKGINAADFYRDLRHQARVQRDRSAGRPSLLMTSAPSSPTKQSRKDNQRHSCSDTKAKKLHSHVADSPLRTKDNRRLEVGSKTKKAGSAVPAVIDLTELDDEEEEDADDNEEEGTEGDRASTMKRGKGSFHADAHGVVGTYGRITILASDVQRCAVGEFLNDNLLEFYMAFLRNRLSTLSVESDSNERGNLADQIHFFSTQFYSAPSQNREAFVKKVDLRSKRVLVVPVHQSVHWSLAVIFCDWEVEPTRASKENDVEAIFRVYYFDSLSGSGWQNVVSSLRSFFRAQVSPLVKVQGSAPDVPCQTNGHDCGAFVLCFMDRLVQMLMKDGIAATQRTLATPDSLSEWFPKVAVRKMRRRLETMCAQLGETGNVQTKRLLFEDK